jgi:hypothetical protein
MLAALRNILMGSATIQWLTGGLHSGTPAYTGWGTSSSALVRNAVLSPDKKLNGMLITEDGTAAVTHGGVHTNIAYTQTAIPLVHTVYIKRINGNRNAMVVMFDSTATFILSVKVDLTSGEVSVAPSTDGSWTNLSCTTRRLSTGWVKIEFFFTGISDTSMWFVYRLLSGINETFNGDTTSCIAVWGTDLRAV